MRAPWKTFCVMLVATSLSACASFSEDGGFDSVQSVASKHLNKELKWAKDDENRSAIGRQVDALLAEQLSADSAIQIALLNNQGLQAAYQELGIAEAEFVRAGTIPNPGFSFGKYKRGDEREISRGWHLNLTQLLFMPLHKTMANRQFAQTQTDVANQVIATAAQARLAFYEAVAAGQRLNYMEQVKKTADTGATLARRMARIGNLTKIQQAREQSFYADAVVNLIRAKRDHFSARERLTRAMGLWGKQLQFTLPERLPDLPEQAQELENAEKLAMSQRLDIKGARSAIERLATNLNLSKVSKFVNVLEFGYERETSSEEPRRVGYEIGFEVPLFNWAGAKTKLAESLYMQAIQNAAKMAIDARSEVREAYIGYRSNYDIARLYRDEIVPARKRVSEENLYRYNGMIIGVFELLADARSQVNAVDGYIQALKDFWIAKITLDSAMLGKASVSAMPSDSAGVASAGGDKAH
ncbi:MAG: TolC family protein [Burkholderiaceae bacterium]